MALTPPDATGSPGRPRIWSSAPSQYGAIHAAPSGDSAAPDASMPRVYMVRRRRAEVPKAIRELLDAVVELEAASSARLARHLGISEYGIEARFRRAMVLFGVESRTEVMVVAMKHGITSSLPSHVPAPTVEPPVAAVVSERMLR